MSAATSTPTPRARRRTRIALILVTLVAIALTPLAVNGLFAGALANADTNLQKVPAAIVNNDKMVTTTAADGTQSVNFAGRGLVTELTGPDQTGFDWELTNSDQAAEGLKDGTYYAVLTIPEDFSATINTLATPDPKQGSIDIRTDDAHGYLSGLVASTVASAVQAGFGQQITTQVVNGIYTSFGTVGTSLSDAAGGATQLGTGADGLVTGANQLADGANQLATGATTLSDGLVQYTDGVTGLATGLDTLSAGTSELPQLVAGYGTLASNLSTGNQQLQLALQQLQAGDPAAQANLVAAATSIGTADAYAANGVTAGVNGLGQLPAGIAQAASGADQLAASGPALVTGAQQIAPGATQLATGATQLSGGAQQLGDGARTLASGLQSGADQLSANSPGSGSTSSAASVITQPVKVDVSRENQVDNLSQVVSTVLLPTALWVGALALFLWLRPFSRSVLASRVSTPRLALRTFARGVGIAAVQVAVLVVFLHVAAGVAWSLLPATLGFSLLVALAFTAFHQWLATAFGRVGAVISLLLLALQLASTGGLYPVEVLSGPFQVINTVSPLAYAVSGVQAILAGGSGAVVLQAAVVMVVLLVLSLLLAVAALARRRRPEAIGWLVPARPAPPAPAAPRTAVLRPQTT
ncbi:YhgE/Pip family protein [Herbiconiux sp. P18]|uniref:YhgE/Pip family protein n=1 Tax=Herbiconiux liangxiaofengii TaxID=3342795 RepID=UPI0035BB4497